MRLRLNVLYLLIAASAFATPSALQIVRRADEARYPKGAISFMVKVTDTDESAEVRETLYRVSTKDSDNSLVETIEPERLRGRKLLMKGQELWMFLPSLKRPTRVGFEQRLTGEVSNGDLARTNFASDYTPKLLGSEKMNGKLCYKLFLKAKRKELPYRKILYWVEAKTYFPLQVKFFALSGKLLKAGTYSDPKLVLNKQRVTQLTIQDALAPKKQSHLNYSDFKKGNFDDSFFNKESLGD